MNSPSVHVPGVRSPRAAGTPADASRLESEDEGAFVEPEFDDVAESQRGMRENVPTTLRQLYSVGDVVGQAGADQSSNHGDLSQWPLPPMRASSTAPWVGLSVFGSGQPDGSDSFPGPAILSGACTLRRTTECTCAAAPPLTPSHTISRPACGPSSADRAPALPQALLPPKSQRPRDADKIKDCPPHQVHLARVDLHDASTGLFIRMRKLNLTIKTSRTEKGGIQSVWSVGCCNDLNIVVLRETIELVKQFEHGPLDLSLT